MVPKKPSAVLAVGALSPGLSLAVTGATGAERTVRWSRADGSDPSTLVIPVGTTLVQARLDGLSPELSYRFQASSTTKDLPLPRGFVLNSRNNRALTWLPPDLTEAAALESTVPVSVPHAPPSTHFFVSTEVGWAPGTIREFTVTPANFPVVGLYEASVAATRRHQAILAMSWLGGVTAVVGGGFSGRHYLEAVMFGEMAESVNWGAEGGLSKHSALVESADQEFDKSRMWLGVASGGAVVATFGRLARGRSSKSVSAARAAFELARLQPVVLPGPDGIGQGTSNP